MITAEPYPDLDGERESSVVKASLTQPGPGAGSGLHLNAGHNSSPPLSEPLGESLISPPWAAKIYPNCGEASIAYCVPPDAEPTDRWAQLDDDERDRCNWDRANRRACAELRRYMVENLLVYMWVLTIADEGGLQGPEGRREIMRRCAAFARRMRRDFGVEVYAYSPELHPRGHGWHVNFFVSDRLPHAQVADVWGHGHVWVSDWRAKVRKKPGRSGTQVAKSAAMSAARYASKYAEKDWSREMLEDGAHRYERSEGHDPVCVEASAGSVRDGLSAVFTVAGKVNPDGVEIIWSDDVDDYHGPPWVFVRWEVVR